MKSLRTAALRKVVCLEFNFTQIVVKSGLLYNGYNYAYLVWSSKIVLEEYGYKEKGEKTLPQKWTNN